MNPQQKAVGHRTKCIEAIIYAKLSHLDRHSIIWIDHQLPRLRQRTLFNIQKNWKQYRQKTWAQLGFSANTFSLNVLLSLTDTYSQSIVNTNNFFSYFYQRKQIYRKLRRIYQDLNVHVQLFISHSFIVRPWRPIPWNKLIDTVSV